MVDYSTPPEADQPQVRTVAIVVHAWSLILSVTFLLEVEALTRPPDASHSATRIATARTSVPLAHKRWWADS